MAGHNEMSNIFLGFTFSNWHVGTFFVLAPALSASVNSELYYKSSIVNLYSWSECVCVVCVWRWLHFTQYMQVCTPCYWDQFKCVWDLPSQVLWLSAVWLWQTDGLPWHSVTDAPAPEACAAEATLPISLGQTTTTAPPTTNTHNCLLLFCRCSKHWKKYIYLEKKTKKTAAL